MIETTGIRVPQIVTIPRAAEITQLPESYIRGLAKSGKIRHTKAGAKYLLNLEDLCGYLRGEKGADNNVND